MEKFSNNDQKSDKKSFVLRILNNWSKLGIYLSLILMIIIFTILSPHFLKILNILEVINFVSVISIIAIGQTFVIAGKGIDLSVGSVVALSGLVMASLYFNNNINPIIAIVAGLATAIFIGFIHGFLIAKTGVPDLIVTLAGMEAWRGIAQLNFGDRTFIGFPKAMTFIGGGRIGWVPNAVPFLILLVIISAFILIKTRLGRYILAIGGNKRAAIFVGISFVRYKIYSYMISGFFCGLAALVYIGRINAIQSTIGTHYPLNTVAAVVVGGTSLFGGAASIVGTLAGSLIIAVIRNGLQLIGIDFYWFMVIVGILIIISVAISIRKNKNKL